MTVKLIAGNEMNQLPWIRGALLLLEEESGFLEVPVFPKADNRVNAAIRATDQIILRLLSSDISSG